MTQYLKGAVERKLIGRVPSTYTPFESDYETVTLEEQLQNLNSSIPLLHAFQRYMYMHNNVTNTFKATKDDTNMKFLIVETKSGLANRMLAIVSAFVVSLVTDRVLLVEWSSRGSGSSDFVQENLHKLFKAPGFDWDLGSVFGNNQPYRKNEDSFHELTNEDIFCHNLNEFNEKYLILQSGQYIAAALQHNPFHAEFIQSIFELNFSDINNIHSKHIFGMAAAALFHPASQLQLYIDSLRLRFNLNTKQSVGIHIRVLEKSWDQLWTEINTNILHRLEVAQLAWQCSGIQSANFDEDEYNTVLGRDLFGLPQLQQINVTKNETVWFLAADNTETLIDAKDRFGSKVVFTEIPRTPLFRGLRSVQEALAEMWILSSCDHVVGTSWSTFSMVAAALKMKPLILVTKLDRDPANDRGAYSDELLWVHERDGCVTIPSAPCYHEWMQDVTTVSCSSQELVSKEAYKGRYC